MKWSVIKARSKADTLAKVPILAQISSIFIRTFARKVDIRNSRPHMSLLLLCWWEMVVHTSRSCGSCCVRYRQVTVMCSGPSKYGHHRFVGRWSGSRGRNKIPGVVSELYLAHVRAAGSYQRWNSCYCMECTVQQNTKSSVSLPVCLVECLC
jgi:hypothetical protein